MAAARGCEGANLGWTSIWSCGAGSQVCQSNNYVLWTRGVDQLDVGVGWTSGRGGGGGREEDRRLALDCTAKTTRIRGERWYSYTEQQLQIFYARSLSNTAPNRPRGVRAEWALIAALSRRPSPGTPRRASPSEWAGVDSVYSAQYWYASCIAAAHSGKGTYRVSATPRHGALHARFASM